MNKNIALIPARKGSERFPNKNIIGLNGHPLIAYSINCALKTQIFDNVIVSTNCENTAEIAMKYGANVPELRPDAISQSLSPDIEWVTRLINVVLQLEDKDQIAILRPTNPLRSVETIRNASQRFNEAPSFDSLRAIRAVKEHPSKMWRIMDGNRITPYNDEINLITQTKSHSSPFQALEELWIQDASLELARVNSIRVHGTISGEKVMGFRMPDFEGFDINYPEDLIEILELCKSNPNLLPKFGVIA